MSNKVNLIGLGVMGRPMARNLVKAGFDVVSFTPSPGSRERARGDGLVVVDALGDLPPGPDFVITVVPDSPQVEEVLFADDGPVARSAEHTIFVDMSTIAPGAARAIGARLGESGRRFLDAPVSGGESGAIAGILSIMVGGDAAAFDKVKPVLACMGKSVTLIGGSGAGQVTKACNQILTGVGVMAVAEALNFARKSGVDAGRVREALLGGFAYSRILENHGQRMLDRNFKPGFKAWMHQKDMNIVLQEAHRLGLMLPTSAASAQLFNAMVGSGLGEEDSVAALKLLEALSGE